MQYLRNELRYEVELLYVIRHPHKQQLFLLVGHAPGQIIRGRGGGFTEEFFVEWVYGKGEAELVYI